MGKKKAQQRSKPSSEDPAVTMALLDLGEFGILFRRHGVTDKLTEVLDFMDSNGVKAPHPCPGITKLLDEGTEDEVGGIRRGIQIQYICHRLVDIYQGLVPHVPQQAKDRGLLLATNIVQPNRLVRAGIMINKPLGESEDDGWILFVQHRMEQATEYLMMPNNPVELFGQGLWDALKSATAITCHVVEYPNQVNFSSGDFYIMVRICPMCRGCMQADPRYRGHCKGCDPRATMFEYFRVITS
jgi:hypothetical protein